MSTAPQAQGWMGPSRRREVRFQLNAPVDITVTRSGKSDTLPGRAMNLCERGLAAIVAGELSTGETVEIEVYVPSIPDPLRMQAQVRYQDSLCCGFEFLNASAEQQTSIRNWAKESKAPPDAGGTAEMRKHSGDGRSKRSGGEGIDSGAPKGRNKVRDVGWLTFFVLAAITVAVFWWKWNRGWEELESGLKSEQSAATAKPQLQVPAELMEKLLVHRVEPVYPPEARKRNLQGIIALDIVVGRDGSVLSMQPLNGPDVLARAAMDALRWWKFNPYRVNGEPAVVETTVAVEFKRSGITLPAPRPAASVPQ